MLRLSSGFRASLSVWSIHEPSPDSFYTCWWSLLDPLFHCKMVVVLIRSSILHVLASIRLCRRPFLHQLLGCSEIQVVQEKQGNTWFSFYPSTFRVMTWYPSKLPKLSDEFYFFLFFFFLTIIVNAWIFIYLICSNPWQSLFIYLTLSHLMLLRVTSD